MNKFQFSFKKSRFRVIRFKLSNYNAKRLNRMARERTIEHIFPILVDQTYHESDFLNYLIRGRRLNTENELLFNQFGYTNCLDN